MKEKFPHHQFAAGVVVFHVDSKGILTWLIIKNTAGHWEFPKGHAEAGESWIQTALRELTEESGITDINLIPGFSRQIRYVFRDRRKRIIHKVVHFAMGKTNTTTVRLSHEHIDFAYLPITDAISRLTHAATRAVLRDAHAFIQSNPLTDNSKC